MPEHDPLVGQLVGGARIVRLIAQGGMGRVYEGSQEKPVRTVAVKVMRPGMTSASRMRRFEYEVEVLGRLQHPGIATIYSAGVDRVGGATVPYFVMEYVPEARPLTVYARERRLPTRERLVLFRDVCEAVAHGHRKGVIHRDLKPGNILVGDAGTPKVIDFGVARATDADVGLTTMQTDVGQLIGTLQYMSPEQFDADPGGLDVRSDVYALGVVLYELLADRPPYEARNKSVLDVMRLVKEEDPRPLSTINRALRGDVEVITNTCLEKDRSRRYSSASELGADIARYLAGEPVTASSPRFVDAVARLARKHRGAAAATGAVLVSLVVALAGITIFAARAAEQRQAAMEARDLASANATRAEAATHDARRRLYVANMLAIGACLQDHDVGRAAAFCAENLDLLGEADTPIELRCADAALDGAAAIFSRHGTEGVCVAVAADAGCVATGYADGLVRVWDVATETPLRDWLLDGRRPRGVALDAESRRLYVTDARGGLRIFAVDSGEELSGGTPPPEDGPVAPAALFQPRLAADGTLTVFEMGTNRVVSATACEDLHPRGEVFTAATAGADGVNVAVGSRVRDSYECRLRVWEVATGRRLATFTVKLDASASGVHSIVWHPAGDLVLALCGDRFGYLWRLSSGSQVGRLEGHSARVRCAAFTSDGGTLVTGAEDGTVRTWDPERGLPTGALLGHSSAVRALAVSAAGDIVAAAADGTTRLWNGDMSGGSIVVMAPSRLQWLAFSPDGTRLAVVDSAGFVHVIDAASGRRMHRLACGIPLESSQLAFAPDGTRLAVNHVDGSASVWDSDTGRMLVACEREDEAGRGLAISPDGRLLASGIGMTRAVVWDMATGRRVATTAAVQSVEGCCRVAFGLGGTRLATGSPEVWDPETGRPTVTLAGRQGVASLAVSPDGTLLATGSNDGVTRIWDLRTGRRIAELTGHRYGVRIVAFSPDGRLVAAGGFDNTVRLWDPWTGAAMHVLRGHTGWVQSLAFSPDGQRLVSGGWDNAARIWDVTTGEQLFVLKGHTDYVKMVSFSPDGTRLATCSFDGTARLWGVRRTQLRGVATGRDAERRP